VHFSHKRGSPSTEVRVTLKYDPPAGKAGASLSSLFDKAPAQQLQDGLQRFKRMMEAGDFAPTRELSSEWRS